MNNKSEDRGMMKWAPFYSVLSEDEIRKSIKKKDRVQMPELSEDQVMELENLIIEAYNSKSIVELTIFDNGKFIKKQGVITKLDSTHKAIYLNKKMIMFNNILKLNYP